jgi:hypothetical protein
MNTPLLLIGIFLAAAGCYSFYYYPKKRKALTEPIDGTVVSFVEGMAYVDKHIGGRYKSVGVKVWYPVVAYTVNGVTHSYTCLINKALADPADIELSTEYKTIPLLYNPANPQQCLEAENIKGRFMLTGMIVLFCGIGIIVLSFVV